MQARFILTGLLFCLITAFLYLFLEFLLTILFFVFNFVLKFFNTSAKKPNLRQSVLLYYLGFSWFMFYVLFLFSWLPLMIGGGQPRPLSLVVTKQAAEILKSFEITEPPGSTYQTEVVCVAYENPDEVILLKESRIISLNMREVGITGLISLPGIAYLVSQPKCQILAFEWISTSFYGIFTNINNEWGLLTQGHFEIRY